MSETGKSSRVKPNRGLGRGLSSLLGDGAATATMRDANHPASNPENSPLAAAVPAADAKTEQTAATLPQNAVRMLPVEWINPGPWQPRRLFEQDGLQELAASMQQQGVVQPILVRANPEQAGRYQIIAGERRWRAAQMAQLHEVPALIRDLSDKDASEIALIENIQRRDLNVIEEALGYQTLIELHDYTQQALANIMGKSRPHITNLMRLLSLPDWVQTKLSTSDLSMGQVRPLIGHPEAEKLARYILEKNLSAREAEKLAKQGIPTAKPKQDIENKSSDIKALEDNARHHLGLSLKLDWKEDKERGTIQVAVRSLDEFEDILKKLGLEF